MMNSKNGVCTRNRRKLDTTGLPFTVRVRVLGLSGSVTAALHCLSSCGLLPLNGGPSMLEHSEVSTVRKIALLSGIVHVTLTTPPKLTGAKNIGPFCWPMRQFVPVTA